MSLKKFGEYTVKPPVFLDDNSADILYKQVRTATDVKKIRRILEREQPDIDNLADALLSRGFTVRAEKGGNMQQTETVDADSILIISDKTKLPVLRLIKE